MKFNKSIWVFAFLLVSASAWFAFKPTPANYEFKLVTTIESVVPGGLGRSRMITSTADGAIEEKEMRNFFSLVGINFKNIKENDEMITSKISQMTEEGWELEEVTSGVYSPPVTSDATSGGTGIFITRYLFKRAK